LFVAKNGSNSFGRIAGSMPHPVSRISATAAWDELVEAAHRRHGGEPVIGELVVVRVHQATTSCPS